jgi:hypothetical protein
MTTRKTTLKKKINEKRLKEFAQWGNFEVNFSDDKVMGVGLKWGESKNLENLGFKRKEQIRMLDFMQDNPEKLKKILGL